MLRDACTLAIIFLAGWGISDIFVTLFHGRIRA